MSLTIDPLEPRKRIPDSGAVRAQAKNLREEGQPDYLVKLNTAQRAAVEHGTGVDGQSGASRATKSGQPLLVIAGAGSGKTNTMAHRVAHLIVIGADPARILMTAFSRRAASEMMRRVERIGNLADVKDNVDAVLYFLLLRYPENGTQYSPAALFRCRN